MTQTTSTEISPDSGLDDLVGYNLKRVYMIFQSDFRATLGNDGLAPRSYSALALAVQNPEITQSDLARKLGIERSGLVAIVDQLESLGLLRRVGGPGDRRIQALTPTEKGQTLFARTADTVARHETRLLSVLTPNERSHLVEILKKLRLEHENHG